MIALDATLVSIGQPIMKASRQAPNTPPDLYTTLWFKRDDEREFEITLTNIDPPGREGTRFTILHAISERGDPFYFSAYNHAASSWIQLNTFRALFSHCFNWLPKWDLILLSLMVFSFIVAGPAKNLSVQLNSSYFMVAGWLFGISVIILNIVRCATIWRFLHEATAITSR